MTKPMPARDFIPAAELAALVNLSTDRLYQVHRSGRGPLAEILVKHGAQIGAWRLDYEVYVDSQRRLKSPGPIVERAAA